MADDVKKAFIIKVEEAHTVLTYRVMALDENDARRQLAGATEQDFEDCLVATDHVGWKVSPVTPEGE
jgi:hypothetical protein